MSQFVNDYDFTSFLNSDDVTRDQFDDESIVTYPQSPVRLIEDDEFLVTINLLLD